MVIALCFAVLTMFMVLNRCHVRDLSEVVRTYATYHKFMLRHPEILYRYPSKQGSGEEEREQIPRIIHQIFLQEGRNSTLQRYDDAIASCQSLHANWTHNLWTDGNATAFILEHYPTIASHYEGYAQSIQRANILRYALLDHFGGIYLDLDITCLAPLDSLLHLPWLTPGAYPAGVNNAFILARPHHPFLAELLKDVPSRDLKWPMPYVENMLSTGCMFFTNRWMRYVRGLDERLGSVLKGDRVYVLADENGNMDPHMLRGKVTTPLFAHGGASSWHGWDAAAIVLIGKHYCSFLMLMGVGVLISLALVWKLTRRSRRGEAWSPLAYGRRSMDNREDGERLLVDKEV